MTLRRQTPAEEVRGQSVSANSGRAEAMLEMRKTSHERHCSLNSCDSHGDSQSASYKHVDSQSASYKHVEKSICIIQTCRKVNLHHTNMSKSQSASYKHVEKSICIIQTCRQSICIIQTCRKVNLHHTNMSKSRPSSSYRLLVLLGGATGLDFASSADMLVRGAGVGVNISL